MERKNLKRAAELYEDLTTIDDILEKIDCLECQSVELNLYSVSETRVLRISDTSDISAILSAYTDRLKEKYSDLGRQIHAL